MSYVTKWELLDAEGKVAQKYKRICFSNHIDKAFIAKKKLGYDNYENCDTLSKAQPHYFRYIFDNALVDDDEMEKYFRFIKATPEFRHLMPKSIKQMVKDKYYTADLTAMNGTQLFTILTLLRAVVEEPGVVENVIKFNPRMKHSLPHLGIIKAAGSVWSNNYNHWITSMVSAKNLNKGINPDYLELWESPVPASETGLVSGIHCVFQHDHDGWGGRDAVLPGWNAKLLAEQTNKQARAKRVRKVLKGLVIRPVDTHGVACPQSC